MQVQNSNVKKACVGIRGQVDEVDQISPPPFKEVVTCCDPSTKSIWNSTKVAAGSVSVHLK